MHINILLLSNENSGINAKPDKKQIYLVPGIWLPKPQETPHHDSSYDGGVSLGHNIRVGLRAPSQETKANPTPKLQSGTRHETIQTHP